MATDPLVLVIERLRDIRDPIDGLRDANHVSFRVPDRHTQHASCRYTSLPVDRPAEPRVL